MDPHKFIKIITKNRLDILRSIQPFVFQSKVIQDMLKSQQEILRVIKVPSEIIREIGKELEVMGKPDFEYNWLSSIPIPFAREIIKAYRKGGNKRVDSFLIKVIRDKGFLKQFKSAINSPEYNSRKEIIDDALQAHLEKKYTLAIPTLLTQCEGIFLDKLLRRLKKKYKKKYNLGRYMSRFLKSKGKDELAISLAHHSKTLYHSERDLILHGRDISYYKNGEKLSSKLIWTLFEIINFDYNKLTP